MIISRLSPTAVGTCNVRGTCAKCGQAVWERLFTLDDCYNVYAGRCPHCQALNLLSLSHGLRGYDSREAHFVLPTNEEVAANGLPRDTPTSGACGQEPQIHGSRLGEIIHRMKLGVD